ncbi:MAG: glycosyltransferase family 39 protein, partial [Anaerolineae bacterium]|nr:glycosyltransferase family 39 protein [Phycisphaerae bacterium]
MTTTLATEPAPPPTSDGDREIPLAPEPARPASAARAEQLGYSVGFDISQPTPVPQRSPGPRLMPRLGVIETEPLWKRALYFLVMGAILAGYSYMLSCYWSPAHPGINQNGYLVGGKNLAEYGTMGMKLTEPYEHLGWMWNLVDRNADRQAGPNEDIWFYPKYPIGTGALFAGCLKLSQWMYGNWEAGKIWSFWVNPAGAVLAVAAMFMLVRQFAGSFAAVLGAMIFGCCQVLLSFAEQPLSHGPALACVTWGMYFLLRWWQTASIWRGILAGLFLGYAVTIRYTEGLLILPVAAVLISMVAYDARSTRWWSLGAWLAIAIAGIVAYGQGGISFKPLSYPSYFIFGMLMVLFALLPAVLERNVVEVWANQHADARVSNMLNYAQPVSQTRKRRVTGLIAHTLRTIIAAGLVWIAIFFDKPAASGPAAVDRMFTIVSIKTVLLGAVALLYLVPWNQPRRYLKLAVPALAWLVPTGILLAYNYAAMGSFSGYDTTNESTAFTWRTFTDKWDDTVQQLYDYSMYLIPPLALAGLFLMYRWSWRAALLVTLWLVPGMLLYIAYYFGKQRPGMWYLRFFLTLFPPMVIAAMWLLKSAAEGMRERVAVPATVSGRERVGRSRGSVAVPLGMGVFAYCSCAVGLMISIPSLEREHASNVNLAYTSDQIVRTIKKFPTVLINDKIGKPVVFAEGRANPNGPLCNFLQFSGDYELYPSDGFTGGAGISGFRDAGTNQPNPMQPERQEWLSKFFRSKNDAAIAKDQNRIMDRALEEGRYVFAVLQPGVASFFRNRFVTAGGFEMALIAQWREPAKVPMERSSSQLDPLARGMPLYPTRASQTWHLYRITRKPAVKQAPTTGPTTKPLVAKTVAPTTSPAAMPAPMKPVAAPTTAPAAPPQKNSSLNSVLEKLHLPVFASPTT